MWPTLRHSICLEGLRNTIKNIGQQSRFPTSGVELCDLERGTMSADCQAGITDPVCGPRRKELRTGCVTPAVISVLAVSRGLHSHGELTWFQDRRDRHTNCVSTFY